MPHTRLFFLTVLGASFLLPTLALAQVPAARRSPTARRPPPVVVGKLEALPPISCPGFTPPPPSPPPPAPLGSLDNPYGDWHYPIEQMPEFPGGNGEVIAFLQRHLVYPEAARREQIEGRVYVRFVVDSTGQVQRPELKKGLGSGCDDEALRVVKLLPRFTPGRQDGRAVATYFTVPVAFKLP